MKGLVFTYVLTYGGALLSFFDPYIGLLVFVCFFIIRPEVMWHWAVPEGNYSRIVAIALLLGWILPGIGHWQVRKARAFVVALAAFWIWSICSISFAVIGSQHAIDFVESMSKILLPFLVGLTTIDSVNKVKQLIWVIVLSQGFVAYEFNMAYLAGQHNVMDSGFGNLDNNCHAIALVTCVG